MENTFDYHSVPSGYSHCFENRCIKKEHCLRYVAGSHAAEQPGGLKIVNPHHIPKDTSECTYFRSLEKIRVAWGVSYIFDNIPYKLATQLRKKIIEHFGRTAYYRFYRHENGIMPEDQLYIRQMFKEYGITQEPEFDFYKDQYKYN